MFLMLYVYDELSYDHSYEKADRVFRVVTDVVNKDGTTSHSAYSFTALGPTMLRGMANVEAVTRIRVSVSSLVRIGERHFSEDRILYADSSFFDLFSYRFLQGAPETALNRPYTAVLTRSTAERYFGDANPIGRTINLDNKRDLEVTAVIEDPPANTHIRFDALASLETVNAQRPGRLDNDWRILHGYTYVLLSDAAHAETVQANLPALVESHLQPISGRWGGSFRFEMQPLTSIHLRSHRDHEMEPGGSVSRVYLLASIAVLVLLIACFNFISLSTAQATERAREVGVRKVFGASRAQLVRQFLMESALIVGLAVVLALVLFVLLLPAFNQLSGKAFRLGVLSSLVVPAGFIAIACIAGILGGAYPAFVLSAFRPARVLKGKRQRGGAGVFVRKALVVTEFGAAIMLMVSAVVIYQQLTYMKNADLGFGKGQVVVLQHVFPRSRASQTEVIKQELLRAPAVKGVTIASEWPTRPAEGQLSFRAEGMLVGEGLQMAWYQIDEHYLEMLGMELIGGRNFSPDRASDSAAVLINQEAAQRFGLDEEAVGKRILAPDSNEEWGTIIGVVKDFHTTSLRDAVEPIVFFYYWARPRNILVKVDGRDVPGALAHIKATWAQHMPEYPLNYTFLDQLYEALYRAEVRISRLVGSFAGLAILIACMGLWGLAAFSTTQRTKEIAVRKVLGASVPSIVSLLSKDYLKLVITAFFLAVPVTYLVMQKWLDEYAYHIDLGVGAFLLSGTLAVLIALTAVSYQAVRAALADPVQSLRYE